MSAMEWEGESRKTPSKKNKKHKKVEEESDSHEQQVKKKKNKKHKEEELIEEEHYEEEMKNEFEEEYEEVEEKPFVHDVALAAEAEWPKEDILELIERMKQQIPEKDSLRYTSRAEKIDWSKIEFGPYTVDDCYNKWKFFSKRIRSYRLLNEILEDAKVWAEKPWSNFYGRGKKVKHPDQPNRPLSSFMLFYMKKKSKIAKANPNLKMTEISKIIGEKYNALPKYKKDMYIKMAKEMQDEYKSALDHFYVQHPEAVPAPIKNNKKGSKDHHGLEKPIAPFKLFHNEKLKKHKNDENFDKTAFLEKCKDQWHNMSIKKRAIWIKWALEAETKYLEELAAYTSAREEPMPTYKSVLTKDEKAILERMAGKPEKPPNSAYSLFSRLMLKSENISNEPPRNRMQEIARQWKLVPPEEKQKYAEQVQHMLETYKLEFATYLESLPEDKRAEELTKSMPRRKVGTQITKKVSEKTATKPKTIVSGSTISTKLYKGEPEKPPGTTFQSFVKKFKKENPHLPENTVEVQAAAHWQTLTESEKEKYQRKHEQAKRKYMQDYEAFLKTLNETELKQYSLFKEARTESNASSSEEESSNDDEQDSESGSSSSEEEDSD